MWKQLKKTRPVIWPFLLGVFMPFIAILLEAAASQSVQRVAVACTAIILVTALTSGTNVILKLLRGEK